MVQLALLRHRRVCGDRRSGERQARCEAFDRGDERVRRGDRRAPDRAGRRTRTDRARRGRCAGRRMPRRSTATASTARRGSASSSTENARIPDSLANTSSPGSHDRAPARKTRSAGQRPRRRGVQDHAGERPGRRRRRRVQVGMGVEPDQGRVAVPRGVRRRPQPTRAVHRRSSPPARRLSNVGQTFAHELQGAESARSRCSGRRPPRAARRRRAWHRQGGLRGSRQRPRPRRLARDEGEPCHWGTTTKVDRHGHTLEAAGGWTGARRPGCQRRAGARGARRRGTVRQSVPITRAETMQTPAASPRGMPQRSASMRFASRGRS